ncbi:Expansin-B9 [Zea mays]|uniref:Expansin-B9 n=1 Tax=Zea mays TaxID=4577 RepID=A0A1D6P776_MAIZE|nr:Expansin-B9 [Zea mays]
MGSLANNIMVVGAVLAALVVGGSCGPPKVPPGPNITTNYLAVLVKFVADDGDIVLMEIQDKLSAEWKPMKLSWGAIWRMDTAKALKGPFSIRLTSESGKKVIAKDIIPANWRPDAVYTSNVQFY